MTAKIALLRLLTFVVYLTSPRCLWCIPAAQAVKTIQLWTLPEVLILHLKRFANT